MLFGHDEDEGQLATPHTAMMEWVTNAASADPKDCPCRGSGFMHSDRDSLERCPVHWTEAKGRARLEAEMEAEFGP